MENQPSTTQVALKWGAITGITLIVFSVILNISGQFGNKGLGALIYVFIIAGIILCIREFKTLNNGFMSFGQGFGAGTLMTAIASILSAIFTYIYMTLIDTTLSGKILDNARQEWEKQGMSSDQIEQAESYSKMFMSPGAIFGFTVVFLVLFGLVVSLIASAIMKKDKPVFD
jgi:hypothetical protein